MPMKKYWPWALLSAVALIIYLTGYRHEEPDSSPLPLFILIVVVVGGWHAIHYFYNRR